MGFISVTTVDSNIAFVKGGGPIEAGAEAGAAGRGAGVGAGACFDSCIYFLALAIALAIMASFSERDIAPLDLNSAFYKLVPSFLSFSMRVTYSDRLWSSY